MLAKLGHAMLCPWLGRKCSSQPFAQCSFTQANKALALRLPYLRRCGLKVQSLHSDQPIQTLPASQFNHSLTVSIQRPYSCLHYSKDPILTNLLKDLILMRPLKERYCCLIECGNLDSMSISCIKDTIQTKQANRHHSVSHVSHYLLIQAHCACISRQVWARDVDCVCFHVCVHGHESLHLRV